MQEPFNPKSEIETGNLPQSPGHKRIEQTSTDRFGHASVFSIRFCSKILRQIAVLNFGFRCKDRMRRCFRRGRRKAHAGRVCCPRTAEDWGIGARPLSGLRPGAGDFMLSAMLGALINSAGILLGGVLALAVRKPVPALTQNRMKILLGAVTVWLGLSLTVSSLNGSAWQRLKLLGIVLLAMSLGKLLGKLLGLQRLSNWLGQFATQKMAGAGARPQFNEGFQVATALFCAAPLAMLGSVQEGLSGPGGFSKVFLVKAVMDGMATMAFAATFGWSVILSAITVLAWQGAIIRGVALLEPLLRRQPAPLVEAVNAANGLLIFCVALIILQLKKVAVADYLPSLALAPLLTKWLW